MVSGGSFVSTSWTALPVTVTVQLSPAEKSVAGSRVNVVGPPETVALCAPLVAQAIENAPASTVTGSLNVTLTFEAATTPVAPPAGVVELTVGAASPPPHGAAAVLELRGAGGPALKSAEFESVSVQP